MKIDLETILNNETKCEYIRAAGPGGQNVNKVATAVQLRFDATHSPGLPEEVKTRLLRLAGSRATDNGEIVITARRYRSQDKNRQDALNRLGNLIRRASAPPTTRKATRPSRSSREKRLKDKLKHSEKKSSRRKSNLFDE